MYDDSGPLSVLAQAARHLAADPLGGVVPSLGVIADALTSMLGDRVVLSVRTSGSETERFASRSDGGALCPPVAAIPMQRAGLELPLRAGEQLVGLLSVAGARSLTPHALTLLTPYADLLALALAGSRWSSPGADLGADIGELTAAHILEEEAERHEIAAALHEGPVQALVAARYAIERGDDRLTADTDPAGAIAVVQRALDAVRRVVGPLRAHPLTAPLDASLRALVAESRAAGVPTQLSVLRPTSVAVTPATAVAAYRVVAAALDGVAGPATVTLDHDGAAVTITVSGAIDPRDAGALARWAHRVDSLGGRLERHTDGVTLVLPTTQPAVLTSGASR